MTARILSPYGGPTNELTKEAQNKARTLRSFVNNENNLFELQLLLDGKRKDPSLPIFADAFRAWGSWQNLMDAAKEAIAKKGV